MPRERLVLSAATGFAAAAAWLIGPHGVGQVAAASPPDGLRRVCVEVEVVNERFAVPDDDADGNKADADKADGDDNHADKAARAAATTDKTPTHARAEAAEAQLAAALTAVQLDRGEGAVARQRAHRRLNAVYPGKHLPIGVDPLRYLRRLAEHEVHDEGGGRFISADDGCERTLRYELFRLERGWSVFLRDSLTGREEHIARVRADEFASMAERTVRAALRDESVAATIDRSNVLRADSVHDRRRIKLEHHGQLTLGTQVRAALVETAGTAADGPTSHEPRLFFPMRFGLGYRAHAGAWGVQVGSTLSINPHKKAADRNHLGGHTDLG